MANIITCSRILCSIALLFCPALSQSFYIFYLTAGFTDIIDGPVARKRNSVSEFGSKLDTVADFVLVVICLIKILPVIVIPIWLYLWIAVIALIKLINVVSGYVLRNRFVAVHTVMNKITGAMLFILPFTLSMVDLKYSAVAVCVVATFAAVQEGHYIRTGRTQ